MAREDPHFRLRIPEYLKELVEAAAQRNQTSMTAEIVARLHESFADDYLAMKVPEGLRQRIGAYAARQRRSINEEILRVLEKEFPPPASISERVDDLLALLPALRKLNDKAGIDNLIDGIYTTLRDVASGRIKIENEQTRQDVRELLQDWEQLQAENEWSRMVELMDDDERKALERGDDPFKG